MANEKRLINANALKESVMKEIRHYWNEGEGGYYLAEDVIPDIDNAPTVDAVEVVHGRMRHVFFSYQKNHYECTCCNGTFLTDAAPHWHYCPKCGAKMDGDGNG